MNRGSALLVEEQQQHHQYHDQHGHERERFQDGSRVRSHAGHANYNKVKEALNSRDLCERLNEKHQSRIQSRMCEHVKSSADSTSLEAELRKLKKRIDDNDKTLIEPYMKEIKPPFTKDILDAPLPLKFKCPR
ncbi:hypothetical protein WN943_025569 [Citrus x changshan-huyou]